MATGKQPGLFLLPKEKRLERNVLNGNGNSSPGSEITDSCFLTYAIDTYDVREVHTYQ